MCQQGKTRGQQLVEALIHVARANHYMIGITEKITEAELDEAWRILVDGQNAMVEGSDNWSVCDRALDMVEQMGKQFTRTPA